MKVRLCIIGRFTPSDLWFFLSFIGKKVAPNRNEQALRGHPYPFLGMTEVWRCAEWRLRSGTKPSSVRLRRRERVKEKRFKEWSKRLNFERLKSRMIYGIEYIQLSNYEFRIPNSEGGRRRKPQIFFDKAFNGLPISHFLSLSSPKPWVYPSPSRLPPVTCPPLPLLTDSLIRRSLRSGQLVWNALGGHLCLSFFPTTDSEVASLRKRKKEKPLLLLLLRSLRSGTTTDEILLIRSLRSGTRKSAEELLLLIRSLRSGVA